MKLQSPTQQGPLRSHKRPTPPPAPQPSSLSFWGDRVSDLGYTVSALPKFIYPTIAGGTPTQQAWIQQALDRLPFHQQVKPISIEVLESFKQGPNYLGLNRHAVGSITLNSGGYDMDWKPQFQHTVIHEVGHSVDYSAGQFSLLTQTQANSRAPYGQPNFVSDYATTQPAEDFAETYAEHYTNPERLQRLNPKKAANQEQLSQPSWLEKQVDRPAFRETGKFIGRALRSPKVRLGLEVMRQASVMMLATNGGLQIYNGIKTKDKGAITLGALQTSAGLTLGLAPAAPWLGAVATSLLGAQTGLNLARAEGASPARQAIAASAGAVGGSLGGFAAPLAAVPIGYALAGPVGGTVGLVLSGLLGSHLGATWSAQAALKFSQDKPN